MAIEIVRYFIKVADRASRDADGFYTKVIHTSEPFPDRQSAIQQARDLSKEHDMALYTLLLERRKYANQKA